MTYFFQINSWNLPAYRNAIRYIFQVPGGRTATSDAVGGVAVNENVTRQTDDRPFARIEDTGRIFGQNRITTVTCYISFNICENNT